jgi:hypothetical protein
LQNNAGSTLKIKTETDFGRSLEENYRGASYENDQKGDKSATWP